MLTFKYFKYGYYIKDVKNEMAELLRKEIGNRIKWLENAIKNCENNGYPQLNKVQVWKDELIELKFSLLFYF